MQALVSLVPKKVRYRIRQILCVHNLDFEWTLFYFMSDTNYSAPLNHEAKSSRNIIIIDPRRWIPILSKTNKSRQFSPFQRFRTLYHAKLRPKSNHVHSQHILNRINQVKCYSNKLTNHHGKGRRNGQDFDESKYAVSARSFRMKFIVTIFGVVGAQIGIVNYI